MGCCICSLFFGSCGRWNGFTISIFNSSIFDGGIPNPKVQAGIINTWSLVGMAIGGIVGGWLSDRYGRVRMATYMLVLFSLVPLH